LILSSRFPFERNSAAHQLKKTHAFDRKSR